MDASHATSYASGLLIGSDVRPGLDTAPEERRITIMGRHDLTAFYAAALKEAGRECAPVDGEQAFLAGASLLAKGMLRLTLNISGHHLPLVLLSGTSGRTEARRGGEYCVK